METVGIRTTAPAKTSTSLKSADGISIAQSTIQNTQHCDSVDERISALLKGLNDIEAHGKTTDFEKTLARVGWSFNTYFYSDEGIEKARAAVMKVLAQPQFSSRLSTVAALSLDAANGITNSRDRSNVLKDGFVLIQNDHGQTEDERSLSYIGMVLNRDIFDSDDVLNAGKTAMAYLASPLNGPSGITIAKMTSDMCTSVANPASVQAIQKLGLEEMLGNRNTSGQEKILSRFGLSLDGWSLNKEGVAAARSSVLSALSCPTGAPLAVTIAKIALDAADSEKDPLVSFNVLGFAFQTILEDTATVETYRDCARLGAAVDRAKTGLEDGLKRRRVLMERILDPKAGIEEIQDLAGSVAREEDPAVISVEDGFVDISGTKLDINPFGNRQAYRMGTTCL